MCLKDMIEIAKSRGYDINAPFLYRHGIKNGFLIKVKDTGKERYQVDEAKFMTWLETFKVDDEWMSINKAKIVYGICYAELKYLIKKNNIETRKMGVNRYGAVHARREDFERIIAQYNKRPEKKRRRRR